MVILNKEERHMAQPKILRPLFPAGYIEHPKSLLAWEQVAPRLEEARNYWLCTVRPDARPHVVPLWAVWEDEKLYFDGSPQTRHAKNIAANPRVSVHLESGDQALIIDGLARAFKPPAELAVRLAMNYARKYAASGYAPEPNQWDQGGLYEITPRSALAWTNFIDDPTKFIFDNSPQDLTL